eukprot:GHVU01025272.1.p1 GENE.GHVU01025272.1~~GHVU01025272.1.p1  ORF type:complete len:389 (+),score=33.06 GHVU01025272.1:62-1168(+)
MTSRSKFIRELETLVSGYPLEEISKYSIEARCPISADRASKAKRNTEVGVAQTIRRGSNASTRSSSSFDASDSHKRSDACSSSVDVAPGDRLDGRSAGALAASTDVNIRGRGLVEGASCHGTLKQEECGPSAYSSSSTPVGSPSHNTNSTSNNGSSSSMQQAECLCIPEEFESADMSILKHAASVLALVRRHPDGPFEPGRYKAGTIRLPSLTRALLGATRNVLSCPRFSIDCEATAGPSSDGPRLAGRPNKPGGMQKSCVDRLNICCPLDGRRIMSSSRQSTLRKAGRTGSSATRSTTAEANSAFPYGFDDGFDDDDRDSPPLRPAFRVFEPNEHHAHLVLRWPGSGSRKEEDTVQVRFMFFRDTNE